MGTVPLKMGRVQYQNPLPPQGNETNPQKKPSFAKLRHRGPDVGGRVAEQSAQPSSPGAGSSSRMAPSLLSCLPGSTAQSSTGNISFFGNLC